MIYDGFIFNNELHLLELRLMELYDVVDRFVLVEADRTFLGYEKTLFYEDNKERFAKWADKITHIKHHFSEHTPHPAMEYEQRRAIFEGFRELDFTDLIILGDVDEIPSRNTIQELVKHPPSAPVSVEQFLFYHYANLLNYEKWRGTVVMPRGLGELDMQEVRMQRNIVPAIREGGWHFSWLGDMEDLKTKLRSIDVAGDNELYGSLLPKVPTGNDEEHLENCLMGKDDLFGRKSPRVFAKPGKAFPKPFGWDEWIKAHPEHIGHAQLPNQHPKRDERTSIPRIAHFYWSGSWPMPWARELSLYSFQRHNPGWKIMLHTPDMNEGHLLNKFMLSAPVNVKFKRTAITDGLPIPVASDLARYKALYEYGGIYFDTDIVFTAPVDDLIEDMESRGCHIGLVYDMFDRFVRINFAEGDSALINAFTQGQFANVGILASVPGMPFWTDLRKFAKDESDTLELQSAGVDALNAMFKCDWSKLCESYRYIRFYNIPQEVICPVSGYDVGQLHAESDGEILKDKSVGLHWYGGDKLSKTVDGWTEPKEGTALGAVMADA